MTNRFPSALGKRILVASLIVLAFAFHITAFSAVTFANDWYASPAGSSIGNGSQSQPWDLCTAIGCSGTPPTVVQPGDIIWLSGGTYTPPPDGFVFKLNGTSTAPIWVRNIKVPPSGYTGQLNPDGSERTILNGNGQNFPNISGSYTAVEGLEFVDLTLQTGNRYLNSLCSGCSPSLYPPGASGPEANGPGNRIIHCIAHDNSAGIYSYSAAPNAEIYGNISYYNGYIYGGEGLGHGYYMQNVTGNKWVTNNFAGDNVDNGFQIYGSGGAAIGFITSGNASYDNGSLASWQYNLVVGSAAGTNANTFDSFYTFFPLSVRNGYVAIGEYDPISNITDTNSVFVGGYTTVASEGIGSPATFSGNKVVNVAQNSAGAPSSMIIFAQFSNQNESGITWDNNEYYGGLNSFYVGAYDGNNLSNGTLDPFVGWQSETGFDAHSTYSNSLPTGAWVYVLPDKYTAKRANIIVYNWNAYSDAAGDIQSPCTGACASVSVDLSSVLAPGDPYIIQDVQNWFGPSVVTGTYTGGTVSIPMTGLGPKPVPWGLRTAPAHTAPAYGTFVVFSANSTDISQTQSSGGTVTTPPPTTTPTPPAPTATGVTPLFTVGQSVSVNSIASPANLRSGNTTTSSIIGTEGNGAVGPVVGGPAPIPATGTAVDILWQVKFADLTGWVWQSLLTATTSSPTPPGSSSTGSALAIATSVLPAGRVGIGYSDSISASGGTSPYSFYGSGLATGLSISSAGLISGTPSQAGSFNVSLTATDSTGASATATLTLVIANAATTVTSVPPSSVYTLESVAGSGQTIVAGQTATFSITLALASVPNETVGLSCAVAPPQAKCSLSQSSLLLSGTPQQFAVSVTTTSPTTASSLPLPSQQARLGSQSLAALVLVFLSIPVALVTAPENRRSLPRLVGTCAVIVLAMFLLGGMTACGTVGSANSNTGTNTGNPSSQTSTPSGSYMVTITATPSISGGAPQTIQVPFSVQ